MSTIRHGFKVSSRNGWFYLGLRTMAYTLHIGLGRLTITVDRKWKKKKSKV